MLVAEQRDVSLAEFLKLLVDFRSESVLVEPLGRCVPFEILELLSCLIFVGGHLPPQL